MESPRVEKTGILFAYLFRGKELEDCEGGPPGPHSPPCPQGCLSVKSSKRAPAIAWVFVLSYKYIFPLNIPSPDTLILSAPIPL